jgi:tetratricopeptide (TPR) repeat protein
VSEAWRDVQAARKAGRLDEAERIGEAARALGAAGDRQLTQQLSWVYYDQLKGVSARVAGSVEKGPHVDGKLIAKFNAILHSFASLNPPRPDLCHSLVLLQTVKVGRHMKQYGSFLRWSGEEPFRAEDYTALDSREEGGPGRRAAPQSLAIKVARELIAWTIASKDPSPDDTEFCLTWCDRILANTIGGETIWLKRDRGQLLAHAGRLADGLAALKEVLRAKRSQPWAWADVAELLTDSDTEVAIACYSRAIAMCREQQFAPGYRASLGRLLYDAGQLEWALVEVERTLEIYSRAGWEGGKKAADVRALRSDLLEKVSLGLGSYGNADRLRAEAAARADIVLFKDVRELWANVVEVRGDGSAFLCLKTGDGPRVVFDRSQGSRLAGLPIGAPLTVKAAVEANRTVLIAVEPRESGVKWDCVPDAGTALPPVVENGVCRIGGKIRRMPKGFGFVDDVYVRNDLAGRFADGAALIVIASCGIDPKKGRLAWRANHVDEASAEQSAKVTP